MEDAVAYMRWERVVPWKILSLKARPGKPPVPVGFGTNNPAFPELLGPGSQIWVVTKIANHFSLAGRVTVRRILDREQIPKCQWPGDVADLMEQWRFVARSKLSNSEFFETNCAQSVMTRHQIRFAQNRTICYLYGPLEGSFRECMDQGRKTVFLSYRWEEARPFALALAKQFRRNGLSPWLDAMALPAYIKKGDPGVNKKRLQTLIKLGIEKSKFTVVINTWSYGKTLWTRMELEHIRRYKGNRWFQVAVPKPKDLECNEPPIFNKKPGVVVQEILERRDLLF
jgi:hypothetical protein